MPPLPLLFFGFFLIACGLVGGRSWDKASAAGRSRLFGTSFGFELAEQKIAGVILTVVGVAWSIAWLLAAIFKWWR